MNAAIWTTSQEGTEVLIPADKRWAGMTVWWWRSALDNERARCSMCRPTPCWRHVAPAVTLEDYVPVVGYLAIGIPTCVMGRACEATPERPPGIAAIHRPTGEVASVCGEYLVALGVDEAVVARESVGGPVATEAER